MRRRLPPALLQLCRQSRRDLAPEFFWMTCGNQSCTVHPPLPIHPDNDYILVIPEQVNAHYLDFYVNDTHVERPGARKQIIIAWRPCGISALLGWVPYVTQHPEVDWYFVTPESFIEIHHLPPHVLCFPGPPSWLPSLERGENCVLVPDDVPESKWMMRELLSWADYSKDHSTDTDGGFVPSRDGLMTDMRGMVGNEAFLLGLSLFGIERVWLWWKWRQMNPTNALAQLQVSEFLNLSENLAEQMKAAILDDKTNMEPKIQGAVLFRLCKGCDGSEHDSDE